MKVFSRSGTPFDYFIKSKRGAECMNSTSRTKLTYLITGLQYGGASIGMVRLLSGLDPEEYDITVIAIAETSTDVGNLLPNYVSVIQLNIGGSRQLHKVLPLIPLLRGADLLVCSAFHASVLGVTASQFLNIPQVLIWQHSTGYKNSVRRGIYSRLYQLSDHVLADSQAVAQMLSEEFGIQSTKVSRLPIAGVDTDQFSPRITSATRDGGDVVTVGTIARLTEEKGLFDLLDCAEVLGSGFQFEVIGEGEKRDALEQNAPDNVTFVGPVDNREIPTRLARFNIYFQPSKYEGLCMTVVEAMSCEVPVVASEVGGIPESVVSGTTGFLCDSGDVDCFVSHIQDLASDKELRQEMGSAGRARVIKRYSQSELVNRFEEVSKHTS